MSGLRLARLILAATLIALLSAVAAGCGGSSSNKSATGISTGATSCAPDQLQLMKAGQLTVGTDNPAYPPWYGGTPAKSSTWKISDPNSGQGFESAVVYAVAKQLGLDRSAVKWVVVPFEQSFKPGPKNFDFDINQVSVTPQRAKSVDFSDSYYDVNQSLVGIKGTPITSAKTIADVKKYKLGVQVGTTSYGYVTDNIKPDKQPSVYSNSNDVNSGLKTHGIDGIVVDLPTAFYITGSGQVPNSVVVGQFPSVGGKEHFGMVFAKGSGLVTCVNKALAALKSSGKLAQIQTEWLSSKASAPVLK